MNERSEVGKSSENAGWRGVRAHGRYNTKNRYDKPKKDIWLRPLRKDWKRILNRWIPLESDPVTRRRRSDGD